MTQQNSFIGPSNVKKAQALLKKQDRKLVDYWWEYPPETSKNVMAIGSLDASNLSVDTPALVLSYRVPVGFVFRLWAVVAEAVVNPASLPSGADYPLSGSGLYSWTLSLNNPVGSPTPMGAAVADFANVTTYLGSFANQPWRVYGRARNTSVFSPQSLLEWSVTAAANPFGANTIIVNNGLFGWLVPESEAA